MEAAARPSRTLAGSAVFLLALALTACGGKGTGAVAGTMKLTIPAFAGADSVPRQFTCDGKDLSPAMAWSGAPAESRGFAAIVDDPDAPGGTFGHWAAFDIDAGTNALPEGAGSASASGFRQARNGFGEQSYGGPCPPRGGGAHRYRFRLVALDVAQLGAGASPSIEDVEAAMSGHVLASATVVARYER